MDSGDLTILLCAPTEGGVVTDLYIDLMERAVTGQLFKESARERRWANLWQRVRHPYLTRRHGAFTWPLRAHTMLRNSRLRNLRDAVEATLRENIPGDYIETGVWRGGACIYMRAILKAHAVKNRKVYCADSFEGLPKGTHRNDSGDRLYKFSELAISEEQVRQNFAVYGLLDEQVVFLRGWFRDTLPKLDDERFAVIRLDGDMYESTHDALENLYPRLSPGGFVIIDDYPGIGGCRRAVHDYLDAHSLKPDMKLVDAGCAWWRKPNQE
jgi:O-methyltransferase